MMSTTISVTDLPFLLSCLPLRAIAGSGQGATAMVQAARKVAGKDAGMKLAHRRLTVLGLAERLGSLSEAYRRGGIDRTSCHD